MYLGPPILYILELSAVLFSECFQNPKHYTSCGNPSESVCCMLIQYSVTYLWLADRLFITERVVKLIAIPPVEMSTVPY